MKKTKYYVFKEVMPMKTMITYGSQYGSSEHYARKFAEYTDFPVLPYREVKSAAGYTVSFISEPFVRVHHTLQCGKHGELNKTDLLFQRY